MGLSWHCSKETKAPNQPQWQLFPKQIHFDPPARSLYNNLFRWFELIMSCSVQKPANSLENEGLQVVIMHFRYFRLNYTNFSNLAGKYLKRVLGPSVAL